jgi:pimeloyl-ACP methyl ester carboxylesterase
VPSITVGDADLYYEQRGAGTPALLFIHGFACTHDDWRHQTAALGAHRLTVACDLRGHGRSSGEPDSCRIATFGKDVAALIDALNLSSVVLIGHSMGCRVALEACRNAKDRVAGLVLIDGSYLGAGGAQIEGHTRAAIAQAGYATFARALFAAMFLAPSAASERVIARALMLPEAIGANLFPNMAGWDAAHMIAALSAVQVPLLIIQSTYLNAERKRVALKRGETTPWLDLVRQLVPGAEIAIVPDVGHFTMLEAPAEVNAHLDAFVARLAVRD